MATEPDVWTDGSLVEDQVSGASSAWAVCFTYRCSRLWAKWRWVHLDEDVGEDAVVGACRGFFFLFLVHCSLFKGLSSWGVILALQANDGGASWG